MSTFDAEDIVADIRRIKGDRAPSETYTFPADLTGHTAHLVIGLADGTAVTTIAGVVTSGTTSTVEFALDAASVATAYAVGEARYAVIIDKDTPALRQTYEAGDWIVIDYAG